MPANPSENSGVGETTFIPAVDHPRPAQPTGEPGAAAPISRKAARKEQRAEQREKNEKKISGFTKWRRQRPFFAGLMIILSGVVMLTPAYLSFEISNIQIQISTMSGVSTLIIGTLLIVCGLMTWFRGDGRILTGIAAMILAIVALPTSNFGGFVIGTLLGLFGGALALSWTPGARKTKEERRVAKEAKKRRKAGVDNNEMSQV